MRYITLIIGIIFLVSSCQSSPRNQQSDSNQDMSKAEVHQIKVEEFIQTTNYTYLKVTEEEKNYWIAIPKREVEIGKTYYYDGGMEMRNFQSKELQRVFESIYFSNGIRDQRDQTVQLPTGHPPLDQAGTLHKNTTSEEINIQPIEGGISIAELFSNKETYSGKAVAIKGKVVKMNTNIMGKNWIHIQDGTKNGDKNYDLTILTNEMVNINEIVTFRGLITLDKDFGSGYFYELIMEDATLQNK